MMSIRVCLFPAVTFALWGMLGCGAGLDEHPTASVTGKVTLNGAAVSGGEVMFFPTQTAGEVGDAVNSGKPARGLIASDGTYSLSTYGSEDGAVVGTHRVAVYKPRDRGEPEPLGEFADSVTVTADKENVIDLALTPVKPQRGARTDDDDDDD